MNDQKAEKIKLKINDYSSIKPKLLETFNYEYPGKKAVIKIQTKEFNAVCPWSGLPDFGDIIIEYIPDKLILELKSFKLYIYSFRNVGIYQEHVINKIFEDIKKILIPEWLKITLTYNVRGGIETTVTREE